MQVDGDGLVAYCDLIKRWVPIIFELRKNQLLGAYLQDNAAETLNIPSPNYEELEAMFPLLPVVSRVRRRSGTGSRKISQDRKSSIEEGKRHSLFDRRPTC